MRHHGVIVPDESLCPATSMPDRVTSCVSNPCDIDGDGNPDTYYCAVSCFHPTCKYVFGTMLVVLYIYQLNSGLDVNGIGNKRYKWQV